MTTYLNLGVERVQSHLARSRHLWGRRGASETLVRLTTLPDSVMAERLAEPESLAVRKVLEEFDGRVRPNGEALDIDGVVSLIADSEAEAKAAGRALAQQIRQQLPATTVKVSWITPSPGQNYAQQLSAEANWEEERYLPAAVEFPLVRLCDECGSAPASEYCDARFKEDLAKDQPKLRLCKDCETRLEHQDRRWGTVAKEQSATMPKRFVAEWLLLDELNENPQGTELKAADHFQDLASMTRPAESTDDSEASSERRKRTTTDNHLALVFADGNGIGDLFAKLIEEAALSGSTEEVREVSEHLKSATWQALVAATKEITEETDKKLPVVPHILGGDDLLASIPADRAWEFLKVFLKELRTNLVGETSKLQPLWDRLVETRLNDPVPPVSVSAAVVICQLAYPFGNQVELAEKLLRRAKEKASGAGWSFTWVDVTQDGPDQAHGVWTLDELLAREAALNYINQPGGLTNSGAQALGQAIGRSALDPAQQRLKHLANRMPEVQAFLDHLGIDPNKATQENLAVARETLSIGRWW